MYSWGDDMSDWARPGAYSFDAARAAARAADAAKAAARGPRAYQQRNAPDVQRTTPKKVVYTETKNPLVIAVDVTGSMQSWPAEIFDRLPLLYQTLSQYRPDLEVSFAAIGDAAVDRYPLQVTNFAKGIDLEDHLKAIYGEGGGGDAPESYEIFGYFVLHHIKAPNAATDAEKPFLIVFGDETFFPKVRAAQVKHLIGDDLQGDLDAERTWQQVAEAWNTFFLLRPTHRDCVIPCWSGAIGAQRVVQITDEQRAVDHAMGLIARAWGHFEDFKTNLSARQDAAKVEEVANSLAYVVLDDSAKAAPSKRPSKRKRKGSKPAKDEGGGIPPTRRYD